MITIHPMPLEDAAVVSAMRVETAGLKGKPMGPEARPMFEAMLTSMPAATAVSVEPGTVGGIGGWWCRPPGALPNARILFLHGGGYVLGSATAYASFASQIALRAGANTFVPDYRVAPECPFPGAIDDAVAAYGGLAVEGGERIAVVGDSAGGGLALALLSALAEAALPSRRRPAAAAVMSPWTDLTLSGPSLLTRAEADPIFTRSTLQALANSYLQTRDASDPRASPLFARLRGLPPIRIDVGDDEILLDDAVRYAERARTADVQAALHIWTGMPHVFQSSLGHLSAAEQSLGAIGLFLRDALRR